MKNKSAMKRSALVLACLLLLLPIMTACGGTETSGTEYSVTYQGVTLSPDMEMSTVLSSLTETYTYSESSACPPFSGTEKLYEYAGVKIQTYSEGGKDYIMGIFLRDDSVNVSGVTIGTTVEEMQKALGDDYTSAGSSIYIYTAKSGAQLKCIVREGAVVSVELLTKISSS